MSSKILSTHTDISLDSTARFRMQGQNRMRHLNSMVSAYASGNQTVTGTAVWTSVAFGAEEFDTDTLHDNSSSNTRLTAAIAGKYLVTGSVYISNAFTAGGTLQGLRILVNGSTTHAYAEQFADATVGEDHILNGSAIISLAANDYVELQSFLNNTGNYTIDSTLRITGCQMAYLGE